MLKVDEARRAWKLSVELMGSLEAVLSALKPSDPESIDIMQSISKAAQVRDTLINYYNFKDGGALAPLWDEYTRLYNEFTRLCYIERRPKSEYQPVQRQMLAAGRAYLLARDGHVSDDYGKVDDDE